MPTCIPFIFRNKVIKTLEYWVGYIFCNNRITKTNFSITLFKIRYHRRYCNINWVFYISCNYYSLNLQVFAEQQGRSFQQKPESIYFHDWTLFVFYHPQTYTKRSGMSSNKYKTNSYYSRCLLLVANLINFTRKQNT